MLPLLLDLGRFLVSCQNQAEKKQAYEREGQMGHRVPLSSAGHWSRAIRKPSGAVQPETVQHGEAVRQWGCRTWRLRTFGHDDQMIGHS